MSNNEEYYKQELIKSQQKEMEWRESYLCLEHHDDMEISALKRKIKDLQKELAEAKKPKLIAYYANQAGELITKTEYSQLSKKDRWKWKSWPTTRACFKARRLK